MDFDLYALRIFTRTVEEGSFSKAARLLGVTQPTVSLQIGKLEGQLKCRLFERVGHDIHLTAPGHELYQFSQSLLGQSEEFIDRIKHNQISPRGLVRYAMPESCQWTPHYRKIMNQISVFPEMQFEIGILPTHEILKQLLESKIDFGFVVGERLHPELRFEKFSDERYSAVAAHKKLFDPFEKRTVDTLRLIAYPGWDLFFSVWAKANGLSKAFKEKLHRPSIQIGTLAGAIHAAQEGAGVAIIPTHCVMDELKAKKLFEWSVQKEKDVSASNPVYIAKRTGEKLPRRCQVVLELLLKAKAELG